MPWSSGESTLQSSGGGKARAFAMGRTVASPPRTNPRLDPIRAPLAGRSPFIISIAGSFHPLERMQMDAAGAPAGGSRRNVSRDAQESYDEGIRDRIYVGNPG
jgi:hypothetical protein